MNGVACSQCKFGLEHISLWRPITLSLYSTPINQYHDIAISKASAHRHCREGADQSHFTSISILTKNRLIKKYMIIYLEHCLISKNGVIPFSTVLQGVSKWPILELFTPSISSKYGTYTLHKNLVEVLGPSDSLKILKKRQPFRRWKKAHSLPPLSPVYSLNGTIPRAPQNQALNLLPSACPTWTT